MRVDPETCRDPDLLAAEVRRLHRVIYASEPTLTDAEREAVDALCVGMAQYMRENENAEALIANAATLRGLLERFK